MTPEPMNEHDVLLVLTICQLLGKQTNPAGVQEAYRVSQENLAAHYQMLAEQKHSNHERHSL
jgi:hypothetical protein